MLRKTMKVAMLYGPDDIGIEEAPPPRIDSDEVLFKVEACAICPSDISVIKGAHPVAIRRIGIMGHEFAGEVVAVGEKVGHLKVGDRAVSDLIRRCGRCFYCKRGRSNLCENRYSEQRDFAFAQYVKAKADQTYSVPSSVSAEEVALTEPLACCVNGIERANIHSGDDVVIVGAGPIGLMHLQLAKLKGARVIISDLIAGRLRVAKGLGADEVIDVGKEELVERVMKATDKKGATSIIVAVGNKSAMEQSVFMARPTATIVFFAGMHRHPPEPIQLYPDPVHYGEMTITGSSDKTHEQFREALKLITTGSVKIKPLISHRLSLDKLFKGIEIARDRKGLKVIVEPNR